LRTLFILIHQKFQKNFWGAENLLDFPADRKQRHFWGVQEPRHATEFIPWFLTLGLFLNYLSNFLEVYNNEILNHPDNRFMGLSIFSEWTTDSSEWEVFKRMAE